MIVNEPSLFDALAAKEEAIQRAEDNADDDWKEAAFEAVQRCAKTLPDFTADDVWDVLDQSYPGVQTHEPAALGPIFLRAARARLIVKAGFLRATKYARRHRDLTVWKAAK